MTDETISIDVPAAYAADLRRLVAILHDCDQARRSNDPQHQRSLRQLAHDRLEQWLGERFADVYAAVNEVAACLKDMLEPAPDRIGYPQPEYSTYSLTLLRDDPKAAREADAILAHFLTKAALRLPPGLAKAASAGLWLKQMGEETWLGSRTTPDGGRVSFRNRVLYGLVHYEFGYFHDRHQTIENAAEKVLAEVSWLKMDWKSLERAASRSRGDFVAMGRHHEKTGMRDRAVGAAYGPPFAALRAAMLLKDGDLPRRKRARKTRKK
jgi:hypothetical protein